MQASLKEIALLVNGSVIGDDSVVISTLSPIDHIAPNALIFAEGADNLKRAEQSIAAAVLVAQAEPMINKPVIQVSNPFLAFIQLLDYFYPAQAASRTIHPTAVIDPSAQ